MEKTTRDIRREAIEAWIDHTKDWDEHDFHYADPKDSFIEGAEWAWRKALREAEAAIAHITRGYMVRGIQTIRLDDAADAISALAEGGAQ